MLPLTHLSRSTPSSTISRTAFRLSTTFTEVSGTTLSGLWCMILTAGLFRTAASGSTYPKTEWPAMSSGWNSRRTYHRYILSSFIFTTKRERRFQAISIGGLPTDMRAKTRLQGLALRGSKIWKNSPTRLSSSIALTAKMEIRH